MEQWWWYFWFSIISLFGASLGNWIHRWRNPKCNGKLPPGSMGLPLIGETLSFFVTSNSIDIHPFVAQRMKRYGSLFKTSLAGRPVVVSLDPDFNYFVLQQEDKLVELYYMDSVAKLVHQDDMKNLGGDFHKYFRRVILSHFGHEPLKHKLLSQFEDMLFNMASKILMSCVPEENLGHDLSDILQGLMTFPVYFPGTAFYKCLKKKEKALRLTSGVLEERMNLYPTDKGDLLEKMVGDMGNEAGLTKQFVSHALFGLLIATIETIAPTITLAAKYLLENPSALQHLTEEQERIVKKREDAKSGVSWDDYKSMTFTHYVINETLRLGNFLPGIFRRTIADIPVHGYTIPKGWILLIIPAVLHLDPNTYEDPLAFNPWRWKNIERNTMAKKFIPFGGGNRACAGAEFGRVLVAVFLHVWLSKYRLTKIKGGDVARAPLLMFKNGFYVKVSEK
ncbi:cytochrome P450 87A3-like isoform X1 [Gossypium australe]|uniref:Cytochrome P450 87A3-like isoform X1 n=1 Tax=Gossypium australe TaxID=47621 RepID=A0A5B6UFD0_9ROSI|nr:cytochrome P450 87A3-like isoform X1 [Gossypium australe]